MLETCFSPNKTKIPLGILESIGNSPIVNLKRLDISEHLNVYAKLENTNPSGSLKDRTSLFILKKALKDGLIKEGSTIIESSSGNMALGLAQACLYLKLNLIVVVDPYINQATKDLLKVYGANIHVVTQPNKHGNYLEARLECVKQKLQEVPNSFWPNQYGNPNSPKAYYAMMDELMNSLNHNLDYLFIATSTCGTLMGCANYLTVNNYNTKIIAVDAKGSILFGGKPNKRLIPGHGSSVPSKFLDRSKIHDIVQVDDLECVIGCHKLLKSESILCGGSTGGVLSAIKKYTKYLPYQSRCAFLISDRGERYLNTIYNDSWLHENFSTFNKSII